MNRLRRLFLAPTWVLLLLTLAAPLAIVCLYSLMTRGAYGGVERPFTFENYTRFWDPLYGAILWRSCWISAVATALCLALAFPLALFIARSGAKKKSVSEPGDSAFLDQLPDPHLRLDVPPPRYRPDQHRYCRPGRYPRTAADAL